MDKIINLQKTVYEITRDYPDMVEILNELGFHDIVKAGMLQTAGRFMTLPKGAAMKKINLKHILEVLEEKGFTVTGV